MSNFSLLMSVGICEYKTCVMANGMSRVEELNEDPSAGTHGGVRESYCNNKTQDT